MDDQESVDVIVVGAGPGGSTAALALDYFAQQHRCNPLSVLLVDKHASQRSRANTILLDAAAAHAIQSFGCDIDGFTPSSHWRQVCPEEAVFNTYPLPKFDASKRKRVLFNAGFLLRRKPVFDVGINFLEDVLYAQIDNKPHMETRHGCKLIALTRTDRGAFCATLEGSDGRRTVEARFVVIADGANSDALRLIGARKKGQRKLETIVSANFNQAGKGNTKYHNNNRSVEALSLATRQGTSVFVKVNESVDERDYALGTEESRSKYAGILIDGARKLGVAGDIGFGFSLLPIVLARSCHSIYQENIFVIGDARHATTPRIALGANVAIMDGVRAAHTIVNIENYPGSRARMARLLFSWHTWLGTHLLTLLGRITTTSQTIKSRATGRRGSALSRAYKFWKTQLLMSLHWSAGRGSSGDYDESDANEILNDASSQST